MATEISFDSAPTTGIFRSYAEDGFSFTTKLGATPVFSDVLWSGLSRVDQGTGNYLVNQYSQDTVMLKYTGPKTFGALSFDLDGYRNGGFDGTGHVIPTTAAVTFNFVGQKADNSVVQFSFTTDNIVGWQHVTLPPGFATGLTSLTWTTNASVEAWGAFDNAAVVVDATDAPPPSDGNTLTATADAAQVTVNGTTLINVTVNDVDPDGSLGIAGFGPDAAHIGASFTGKSLLGADIRFESGQLLYTANATSYANLGVGQTAVDSFHYAVVNEAGDTSSAEVLIKIVNPGNAPTLTADTAAVNNDQSVTINVLANDRDNDPGDILTLSGFGPNSGSAGAYQTTGLSALGSSVSIVSGKLVYNANATVFDAMTPGSTKVDTVYYTVTDSHGASSTSSVAITVNAPQTNRAPTLTADTAAVNNDQSVTINVLANDSDPDTGDTLTLSSFGKTAATAGAYQTTGTSALGSSVSIVSGKLVYNANASVFDSMTPGATKVDTVYYTVTDSHGASSTSSVSITVSAPQTNRAPVLTADTAAVNNDQSVTINVLANDSDPDTGDTLTLKSFGKTAATAGAYPATGTSALGSGVSIVNGKLVYSANATVFDTMAVGATKVDTIYYTVVDSKGASSVSSVAVTVTNPNHAPVATADTGAVVNNKAITLNVLANDRDPDTGDTLSVSGFGATSGTANGSQTTGTSALGATVSLQNGQFVYTANANVFDSLTGSQTKVDTFYYTVKDTHGGTHTAAVNVTVSAGASAPPETGSAIDGTKRDDVLTGTSKSEVIRGLDGDDKITGGAGNDTMTGGDDEDTFVLGSGFGKDVITDFKVGHWECEDDHDNRDGDKKDKTNGKDDHDDDRNWWDGDNNGRGYGSGNGRDHDDDRCDNGSNGRGHEHDWEWVGGDVLKISKLEFRNYEDLMDRGANTSKGVLFTTADGKDSILLQGVTMNSLHSGDFLFY